MNERVHVNDYFGTMICVDSYQDNVLRGWFQNFYFEEPQLFNSLSDFIIKMESILDVMSLHKSYYDLNRFRDSRPTVFDDTSSLLSHGAKATFYLTVRFRQNVSWQGTINWLEGKSKQNFRSVLELIVLMDGSLREQNFPFERKDFAAMS